MGFFARIGTFFRSNINDMISKAEDPEKMLHQVVIDMKQQLTEAKKQLALAIADEKRLKKQYEDQHGKVEEWDRRAVLAVQAQDDDLAREALKQKHDFEESAGMMEKQWQSQHAAVEKLKDSLRVLNNRIEEAKRKKNILIARKKRAEAQKAIQETMAGLDETSAFETFERMSNKVEQLEAEAEAGMEIAGQLVAGDKLEDKFKALEAGDMDQKLLELKEKVGLLPVASADSAAKPSAAAAEPTPAIEDELAALKAKMADTAKS